MSRRNLWFLVAAVFMAAMMLDGQVGVVVDQATAAQVLGAKCNKNAQTFEKCNDVCLDDPPPPTCVVILECKTNKTVLDTYGTDADYDGGGTSPCHETVACGSVQIAVACDAG